MQRQSEPSARSIRAVLLINLVPTLGFAALILVGSAGVVWWIGAQTSDLAAAHAQGALTPEGLRGAGDTLAALWLAALGAFIAATAVGLLVTRRAYRTLSARLERVARFADSISRGAPEPAPRVGSDDALGGLEASLGELARAVAEREQALRDQHAQRAFEGQVAAALKMAADEARSLDVVRRAFEAVTPSLVAELLLADSSQAHLRRAAASRDAGAAPLCGVEAPVGCPAAAGGHRRVFADSRQLDACHHLSCATDAPCGAACFPVAIAGRTVGVIHSRCGVDAPHPEHVLGRLESLAQETGARLGMLRALSASELAAATDTLTGLLNRRSLDAQYSRLTRAGQAPTVVMADLDHFKRLNDTYGHETGDRALRAFAQCMTVAVRAGDVVARLGGEEFVLVLPGAPVDAVVRVVGSIRRELRGRLGAGHLPLFTVSFGVATGPPGAPLDELLRAADSALYEAKQAGRNRTVAHGRGVVEQGATEDEPAAARVAV